MTLVPPTTTTTTTAPSTTTTTTVPRTTTPPKTTTAISPVPGAVTANAHAGAGSGEVQVDWQAVRRATGYRILRTHADGRNPRIVADLDITTGRTSAASEVVNIYSAGHTYRPDSGLLSGPDISSSFTYIDYAAGRRCYRLLAYNLAGAGPMSAVVCAASLGDDS
ncbi:hypothetical protein [Actinophytocola sp. NPDC049390]|uniref:hypothetical protein n=1 Tax=Actinophytocola sp. NPDC049390 TaxID=3363894 RepID=UPI003799B163